MLSINDIVNKLPCIKIVGNKHAQITDVIKLDLLNERPDVISWCSNKNIELLEKVQYGTVICSELVLKKITNNSCNYIIVDNPRRYFSEMIAAFFHVPPVREGIAKTAVIHASSSIGSHCFIGENVVIEENCVVGNHCMIGHNTVLHHGTVIKNNVIIGCSNTIGGFGYGYEKDTNGWNQPIPHIGNVVIDDDVEICNNTCIDRAALGSTYIGKNVKVSNLVHIGHGVEIGANSLIIANAMIAGSTVIGENVWISPSSSIINKSSVGNNAVVGLSAVVIKPVRDNTVVVGNPARELAHVDV